MSHDERDRPSAGAPRRDVLRGIFCLGFLTIGGGLLGESLLLRPAAAQDGDPQSGPTTLTASQSRSYTLSGTVPPTITFSGKQTPPEPPGTFTRTAPPDPSITFSETRLWPAPGGGQQTVTVAGTMLASYTPPATNTQTVSWRGSGYTITNVRSPTYFSVTLTESRTVSYTSTTPLSEGGKDPVLPAPIPLPADSGGSGVVEWCDAPGAALFDARSRQGAVRALRFACGVPA